MLKRVHALGLRQTLMNRCVAVELLLTREPLKPVQQPDRKGGLAYWAARGWRNEDCGTKKMADRPFKDPPPSIHEPRLQTALSYRLRMLPNVPDRLSCSARPDSMRPAGAEGAETAVDR